MQILDVLRKLEKNCLANGKSSRDFQLKAIYQILENVELPLSKFGEYGEAIFSEKAESQFDAVLNAFAYIKADPLKEAWSKGKLLWPERQNQLLQKREEIVHQFRHRLLNDYMQSEELARQLQVHEYCDVQELRRELVKRVKPDVEKLADEQLDAIADTSDSCLLRARAGSGKTTVIKHKVDFLIRHAGFHPDEIMVLAFNKVAAEKIRSELQSEFGHINFFTARTFHSLAHQIVKPKQNLLVDQKTDFNTTQSQFVEALFLGEIDKTMEERLYQFLREEMLDLEQAGSLLSREDYYILRRSSGQDTLKCDFVSSIGEKWIADYLFEHDVEYIYDRAWPALPGQSGNYHPYFSVKAGTNWHNMIIEYWEINEFDNKRDAPRDSAKSWQDCHNEILVKRLYWQVWNQRNPRSQVNLLEMSFQDTRVGREAFERTLTQRLAEASFRVKRLSKEQIIEKVKRKTVSRLAGMCLQYINKAKKSCKSPEELADKLKDYEFRSSKEKIFLELANRIYSRYQEEKFAQNMIDFDDLMQLAEKAVHAIEGNNTLHVSKEKAVSLRDLKWLMIDEYQDFSELFFNLIQAIRQYNPSIRLFCVGDNWQAINGFAGSDLRFFNEFGSYFEGAKLLELRNNYRSQPIVVKESNRFMQGEPGSESIPKAEIPPKPLQKLYKNNVPFDEHSYVLPSEHRDFRYQTLCEFRGKTSSLDLGANIARQLKLCRYLILQHDTQATSYLILNRTNTPGHGYSSLRKFQRKLKSCFDEIELNAFRNFDEQVQCWTAHGSKGAEADVVIILGAVEKRFPMMHPDNELYFFLGDTLEKVYLEEKRLFYVAITRAKQSLYLITERGRESGFLNRIETQRGHIPYIF
jgi:DNA helicase-4